MQKLLITLVALLFSCAGYALSFQKSTFSGDWEGKKNVPVTLLLEDKGIKNGLWTRVLYYGTAEIKNDSLGIATHVYKELKPGRFEERVTDNDITVVGEAVIIGKIENWVELKITRQNLCKVGMISKQDSKSKDCKYEQRIVCEKFPTGDKCTDTFYLDKKIVGSAKITQFTSMDAKSFSEEVAKVFKQ